MNQIEGYVGIDRWEGQWVDDLVVALLLLLFISFACVFRLHYRLFFKMAKDAFYVKKRLSLFEEPVRDDVFFRNFMFFQALLLCGIAFFLWVYSRGYVTTTTVQGTLLVLLLICIGIFLFYAFKRFLNYLIGIIFVADENRALWLTSYNAIVGLWGVSLYIPVIWMAFGGGPLLIPVFLFFFLYILSRFAIIYKSLRIFSLKSDAFLYLSLYLCAQEILPLFLFYKGSIYLYNFIEMSTIWR